MNRSEETHITLAGEPIDLGGLTIAEKAFWARAKAAYSGGESYPDFVNRINVTGSPALGGGQWVTSEVAASAIYRACEDLCDRLGIAQGFIDPA